MRLVYDDGKSVFKSTKNATLRMNLLALLPVFIWYKKSKTQSATQWSDIL